MSVCLPAAGLFLSATEATMACMSTTIKQQPYTPTKNALQEPKEYVIVNFFHLVDLERPWEVRKGCICSPTRESDGLLQACRPSRLRGTALTVVPAAAALPQMINKSKAWMEGKDVRGRIYFSEQVRPARSRCARCNLPAHRGPDRSRPVDSPPPAGILAT